MKINKDLSLLVVGLLLVSSISWFMNKAHAITTPNKVTNNIAGQVYMKPGSDISLVTGWDPFFHNWSWDSYFFKDPFAEIKRARQQMNQALSQNEALQTYNPKLSLEETNKNYLIKVDLPGLEKDSIDVKLENNLLTVSGEREVAKEIKDDNGFYRSEISYGAFQRAITLPDDIQEDKINAKYKNGVLAITVPRLGLPKKAIKKILISD